MILTDLVPSYPISVTDDWFPKQSPYFENDRPISGKAN